MRASPLVTLACFAAVPLLAATFAACSADEPPGDAGRGRTDTPSNGGPPALATPAEASIAIASPASGEIFVTNKDRVSLRGLGSGKIDRVDVSTSAGGALVATGTTDWTADDVPVPVGKTQITVKAGEAADDLVVVRTQQLGFTAPASIYPDGVVVATKTAAIVRVPLDPSSTIDPATLSVYRKAAGTLTKIGSLHDDGKNGDEQAGDGVFSTTVLLEEPTVGRTAFHVGGKGPAGEENAVAVYVDVVEPVRSADLAAGHDLLLSLDAAYAKKQDVNDVLAIIRASALVKEHAVTNVAGDFAVSLRLQGDIPGQWRIPLPAGTRGNPSKVVGNNKAFIASPYLDQFNETDEGPAVQGAFSSTTCPAWNAGTGPLLVNDALDIAALRKVADFGAIHVSSHGSTWAAMRAIGKRGAGCDLDEEKCKQGLNWYDGPGTEVILFTRESPTDTPSTDRVRTQDYSAEMRQGRIGIAAGSYFVTPKFFAGLPKRFPNSVAMFSICRGAFNGTMADAFIRKGAAAYLGFSEIVNSDFADGISRNIWGCLLDNEANGGQGKAVSECLPAQTCDNRKGEQQGEKTVQCQLKAGTITCAKVDKIEYAFSCLRTFGDTGVKFSHVDAKGKSCQGSPTAICGDGKRSPSEPCEGSNLGGATCESLFGAGNVGTITCSSNCVLQTADCAVCNADGKKDAMEGCDGADLGGFTCPNGGTASCTSNCLLDTSFCKTETCNGNGIRDDAGEACDGPDNSTTCEALGYESGAIACTADCKIDTTGCVPFACVGGAANGTRDAGEQCDGTDFGGETCASLRKDDRQKGTLSCGADCRVDLSGCALTCEPNGVRSGDEACDGTDFGGATCKSLTGDPNSTGALACNGDCSIDASACGSCNGNGKKDGTEACEGADVGGATCVSVLGTPYATGKVTCRANCSLNKDQCTSGKQCEKSSCTKISPSGNGGPKSLPPFLPGCDACTAKVCATDPHCCETQWDYTCYQSAIAQCGCK